MTEAVVVQSRDRNQRTIITWYPDLHEAERGRPIAWVGAGQLHIDADAPAEVARRAIGLFNHELLADPWQDLAWLATHIQTEPGGVFRPVRKVSA